MTPMMEKLYWQAADDHSFWLRERGANSYEIRKRLGPSMPRFKTRFDRDYSHARFEHAMLLRFEGFKLAEIATRLGVTKERGRQIMARGQRRLREAIKYASWRIVH